MGRVSLPDVSLWDPNDPLLYKLKLTLLGDIPDVVHSYFGMRSLSERPVAEAGAPAALCLNGRQIYIRGALYQSFFPDGIYTAGDVSVIQNDILFAKSAGFDLLRVHIKIDDPLLFYYADTLGILRRHGKLSAYIFTELHDVEWERNGFLNYDRTPKSFGYDPTIINHGDVLPIDAPPIRLCQPGENVILEVMSSHFCRRKRTDVTLHWRLSGIDSIGWVHNDLTSGSAPIPFTHHRVELAQRLDFHLPNETHHCHRIILAQEPVSRLQKRPEPL